MRGPRKKLAAATLLIAGIILAILNRTHVLSGLEQFLEGIQAAGPAAPLALGLVYILATVLFVPGVILTLAAGFIFGTLKGTVIVSLASTAGAALAFLLGRTLLRETIENRVQQHAGFRAIDHAVGQRGFRIVMLIRLSPIFPFNFLNYAFGLTSVSFRDYVLGSWIGMFPATVMYVYFGSALQSLAQVLSGNLEGGQRGQILLWVGLVATIVVTVYVTQLARKALKEAVPSEAPLEEKI